MNEGEGKCDTPFSILVKIRFMKIVTFCIYITICFLIIGCKKSTSTIRDNAYDSVKKYETELEKLCLESHNGSVTYSIRIKTEDLTNDYEYKYLGSLKIKKNNFKVIQQKNIVRSVSRFTKSGSFYKIVLKGKIIWRIYRIEQLLQD